jgi:hypothetical protein
MKLQGRGRISNEGFLPPPHHHQQETQHDSDYLLFEVEQVKLLFKSNAEQEERATGLSSSLLAAFLLLRNWERNLKEKVKGSSTQLI